jgi:hypothetical protein
MPLGQLTAPDIRIVGAHLWTSGEESKGGRKLVRHVRRGTASRSWVIRMTDRIPALQLLSAKSIAIVSDPITFQIRPQGRERALFCGVVQNHQQAAAGATQSVYCCPKAAEKQREAPPHLGIDPHSGAGAEKMEVKKKKGGGGGEEEANIDRKGDVLDGRCQDPTGPAHLRTSTSLHFFPTASRFCLSPPRQPYLPTTGWYLLFFNSSRLEL